MQKVVKRTRNAYRKGANIGTTIALQGTELLTMPAQYIARRTPKPIRGYSTKLTKLPSNAVRIGGQVIKAAPNTTVRAVRGMGGAARNVLGAMTMPIVSLLLPEPPKRKQPKRKTKSQK